MSDHISIQHTTSFSPYDITPERAITTTVLAGGVVIVAILLSFPIWGFSLQLLGASNDVLDQSEGMLWLSVILIPIASAGAYWLALLRLRKVKTVRALLETFGLSLLYWLAMPIVLNLGAYALQSLQLLNQNTVISPGALGTPNLPDTVMFIEKAPGLILYIVLMALCTCAIGLCAALFFARWDKVRESHLHSHGWLGGLLVLGCAIVATLLTGLAFMYLETLGLIPVPGALLASIAAWTTYRTLRRAGLVSASSTQTVSEV